jgi:hypothetical protein
LTLAPAIEATDQSEGTDAVVFEVDTVYELTVYDIPTP